MPLRAYRTPQLNHGGDCDTKYVPLLEGLDKKVAHDFFY